MRTESGTPTGRRTSPWSAAAYQAAADLREAMRRFEHQFEAVGRRHGLTPQRFQMLLMIKGAPDGSQRARVTDLANRLQLAQSTVTELVGRAEDAGLVMRHFDPWDARIGWITLTDRAERQLAAAAEDLDRAEMSQERERLKGLLSQPG